MRYLLICWFLFFWFTGGAQTYSTYQYEVNADPLKSLTINQDPTFITLCGPLVGPKYGFQSFDEQFIPELTNPSAVVYGGKLSFFYSTPGIYAINPYYKTVHSDIFSCWTKNHRLTKLIYIYVKPAQYTQTITLPIGGDPYYIAGPETNDRQFSSLDCRNEIQPGFQSAYHPLIDELTSTSPTFNLSGITFHPDQLGTFTITPYTRYVERGNSLPCKETYTDVLKWQPLTIVVENFTWKETIPTILCKNQGTLNLSTYMNLTEGVTFEGPGVSGSVFNPFIAGVGTHVLIAKKLYSGGEEFRTVSVEVIDKPIVTVSLPVQTCNDIDLKNYFAANFPGGSWSFAAFTTTNSPTTGITGSVLSPSLASVSSLVIRGTYTVGGCSSAQVESTIAVIPGATALAITTAASHCQSPTPIPLTYTFSGGTASTITWSGPGVTGSTLQTAELPVDQVIPVKITITTTSGCTVNASKSITVKPRPAIDFATTEFKLCYTAETVNLADVFQPRDAGKPVTGSWTVSNPAITLTGPVASLSGSKQASGTLTFQYTNSGGCQVTESLPNGLQFYEQPVLPTLSVSPATDVCAPTTFTLATSSVSSNLGINWFGPSGYLGSSINQSTGLLAKGAYVYNLIVNNNSNGDCYTNKTILLEVDNPTPISFSLPTVNACVGEYTLDLLAKAGPNYTTGYFTSTNSLLQNRLTSNQTKLDLAGLPTGNYVLTYNVLYNSCVLTKDLSLVLTSAYSAPAVGGNLILCQPQTTQLTVTTPAGGVEYRWYANLTDNTPLITANQFTTPRLEQNTLYYVQAFNPSTKCGSVRSPLTIYVQRMDQIPINAGTDLSSCTNQVSFNLNRSEVTPATGTWSGPGVTGSTFTGNALANNKAYTLLYSYTEGLCTKRDTLLITLGIDLKPKVSKRTVYTGEFVAFEHNYPSATSTLWTFGDGIKSSSPATSHVYYTAGGKNISLTIEVTQNGTCKGTLNLANYITVVDTTTLITEVEPGAEAGIHLFPNPWKSTFYLQSEHLLPGASLELYSALGQLVWKEQLSQLPSGSRQELQPPMNLPAGTYYLTILLTNQNRRVLKLIKE